MLGYGVYIKSKIGRLGMAKTFNFTCTSCHKDYVSSQGKCHACNSWGTIVEKYNAPKIPKPIAKVAPKKIAEGVKDESMTAFFEYHKEFIDVHSTCENCKQHIYWILGESYWRSIFAHVLPKKHFKSIALDNDNVLYLCLTCHSQYDSSWLNASKMNIWDKAKGIIKGLLPKIAKTELKHLPNQIQDND